MTRAAGKPLVSSDPSVQSGAEWYEQPHCADDADDPDLAPPPLTPGQAFDALYAYCAPTLVQQTYLLTGQHRLAREAVEQAFQLAWQRWPEVAVDRDPAGWVRAAAHEYALSPGTACAPGPGVAGRSRPTPPAAPCWTRSSNYRPRTAAPCSSTTASASICPTRPPRRRRARRPRRADCSTPARPSPRASRNRSRPTTSTASWPNCPPASTPAPSSPSSSAPEPTFAPAAGPTPPSSSPSSSSPPPPSPSAPPPTTTNPPSPKAPPSETSPKSSPRPPLQNRTETPSQTQIRGSGGPGTRPPGSPLSHPPAMRSCAQSSRRNSCPP